MTEHLHQEVEEEVKEPKKAAVKKEKKEKKNPADLKKGTTRTDR